MTENTNAIRNVLFLCTGNSARSILAECLLNKLGAGRFKAFSAGSQPKGQVHPFSLRFLQQQGYSETAQLRSKSWDEFIAADAPNIDFVVTVCDNAAGEACPLWPGHPMKAHWGVPDPAATTGSDAEIMQAFATTYQQLGDRIKAFLALPFATLDSASLKQRLNAIGQG